MGHNGSTDDDIIHVALIAQACIVNYQLPTSSATVPSNITSTFSAVLVPLVWGKLGLALISLQSTL